jgi:hypothetical protein
MLKTIVKHLVPVLLLLILAPLGAQVNKSNLTGVIRDATDAIIPAVSVRLTNLATGATRTATTNETGLYRFTLVPCRW